MVGNELSKVRPFEH